MEKFRNSLYTVALLYCTIVLLLESLYAHSLNRTVACVVLAIWAIMMAMVIKVVWKND